MPAITSVDTHAPSDALSALGAWSPNFPSAELVESAVSMFTGHRISDRTLGVTLLGVEPGRGPAWAKTVELYGDPRGAAARDRLQVEGPRWRVIVSPGTVAVRRTDPVRADRARERAERARWLGHLDGCRDEACAGCRIAPERPANGSAGITAWSSKSRAKMVETIQSLDWSTFIDGERLPGLVTLTYPGDWLAVAPNAAASRRHLLLLRKRFERAWGEPLVCVWKREFQDRCAHCQDCRRRDHEHPDSGRAPHFHLLMVPPHGRVNGLAFPEWLSREWATIVASEWCGSGVQLLDDDRRIICCERHRHIAAGTGVDFDKGARATDPRKIGVYFAKHGSFAAKDYQNEAPAEWVETGSVGRFWGVWGLSKAVAAVEVHADEAKAAVRTLRRHSRANSYVVRVPVWRYRTVVDQDTGEVRAKWRRATKKQRVWRMKHEAGFVAAADGPALAAGVARHLDGLYRPQSVMRPSGAGPVGFLP